MGFAEDSNCDSAGLAELLKTKKAKPIEVFANLAGQMRYALALFLPLSPVFAASPCPDNYRPYSFQGTVAEIGKTAAGRPSYVITNISNPACGDEHQRITAYPLAAVVSCAIGKSVTASGTYTKSCVDAGKAHICLAQVGLRDSKGAIDTTKGATVTCK